MNFFKFLSLSVSELYIFKKIDFLEFTKFQIFIIWRRIKILILIRWSFSLSLNVVFEKNIEKIKKKKYNSILINFSRNYFVFLNETPSIFFEKMYNIVHLKTKFLSYWRRGDLNIFDILRSFFEIFFQKSHILVVYTLFQFRKINIYKSNRHSF